MQALLDIDKNNKIPVDAQLLEACSILGVCLDVPLQNDVNRLEGVATPAVRRLAFTAKEEWVLRWLLSKLQAQDDRGRE